MPTISGTDFAKLIPEKDLREREEAIFEALREGLQLDPLWVEVLSELDGHSARLFVSADAFKIGNAEDAIRVNLTAKSAQRLADHFDALLPTTKICDLVWAQAHVRLSPCIQTPDSAMAFTSRMVRHSREVDEKARGRGGLIENVGKHWVLSNKLEGAPTRAANYGWFKANGSPIQTLGTRHGLDHVDYSQVVRLVRRDLVVDGAVRQIEDIARDPVLSGLVSSEGPLRVLRLPGVALEALPRPAERTTEDPASWRVLEQGMEGKDVAAWQRVLIRSGYDISPWNDDGKFGKGTHNATVSWQRERRLAATGIVDRETRAAIGRPVAEPPEPEIRSEQVKFVQAKNYTRAARRAVDVVVIHTSEAAEASTTAENLAAWASGAQAPRASWHYGVDSDSIVQCVKEEDVAWAAPSRNANGIHLEHAGYARQTAEQWNDSFSVRMLERSARLTAEICGRWQIPIRFVDAAGLLRNERGITTHWEITKGPGKGRTDHTDPGRHFPMARYIELVNEEAMRIG